MSDPQLSRVRWGVRGALLLGVATSVAANILHARPNPISQAIAAWPPLALLLTVELISRIPVHRRSLSAVRLAATAFIAGIAAWVSYWHMAGVASRYGEVGAAPYLMPLSVDGLVVVASVCLVELSGRLRSADAEPAAIANVEPIAATAEPKTTNAEPETTDTTEDRPADIKPDIKPDISPDTSKAAVSRTPRKRDTGKAVARLRARHPNLSAAEIAKRLGVTDRTVRRHLSSATH
jgi:DNA-binding CsgD family transcriptional regulator